MGGSGLDEARASAARSIDELTPKRIAALVAELAAGARKDVLERVTHNAEADVLRERFEPRIPTAAAGVARHANRPSEVDAVHGAGGIGWSRRRRVRAERARSASRFVHGGGGSRRRAEGPELRRIDEIPGRPGRSASF